MKKILLSVGICSLSLFTLIIVLDLLNISNLIPLTKEYDWLSFIGTYFAGVGTIFLGIVSINQNNKLSNLNKKMLSNNMVSNCFSQIDLIGKFYIEDCKNELVNCYGYKMKNNDNIDSKNYHRIIIQLLDTKQLPLESATINKLTIQYKFIDKFGESIDKESIYYPDKSELPVELEVTPNKNEITYYLPVSIIDSITNLNNIINNNNLRIIADISIINSFGVVSNGEYTFKISKTSRRVNNDLWIEYGLIGRKIYYKNISYERSE